ncbi:MAG: hypothetical protein FWE06_01215 [Oscillospiraceae bacterium]|nr:hypothetical protein [Oscillospiraceae bacterium]
MEMLLFYSYLKYQKEIEDSTIKKILCLPWFNIALPTLAIIGAFASIIFAYIFQEGFILLIPLALLLVLGVIGYLYVKHVQIINSNNNIFDYRKRCSQVFEWLKGQSILERSEIQEYRNRLSAYVEKNQNIIAAKKQRLDRWMQTLLIPVTLVVFSAFISEQTDTSRIMEHTFTFITIVIASYSLILLINYTSQIFTKQKLERIQRFVDDLQGVLDTQFREK